MTIWRAQLMEVLCVGRGPAPPGQLRAVRKGKAQTRWLQDTGTRTIKTIHFNPKHVTMWLREERTGSR